MDSKKILPLAIIGVALLSLVAYAVFFGPNTTQDQIPLTGNQTNTAASGTNGATGATGQAPAQTPPATIANKPVSSKDPATIVPAGVSLKDYCDKYYKAWKASDWQTAYDLQPLQKKSENDVNGFSSGLQGYGMVGYTIKDEKIDGSIGTVTVNLDLGANGIWATNWTFVKNDKGQWTAQDSKSGMIQ